jgi:hypothetical protein
MSRIYARRLLERYPIREPKDINLARIADDLNITVGEDELEGCDGMLQMIAEPKCGIITVKSTIREAGQKRFIIAHEIGHFEAPARPGLGYNCAPADLSPNNRRIKPEERAANEFAAELLMPESLFVPRVAGRPPCMELVKELASEFGTTLTATLRRFVDSTDGRCALVCSENRKIKYSVPSKKFGHRVRDGASVDGNSFAVDFFNFRYVREQAQSVLASAWLEDSKLDYRDRIKEQSVAQPHYNSVLTLLWID